MTINFLFELLDQKNFADFSKNLREYAKTSPESFKETNKDGDSLLFVASKLHPLFVKVCLREGMSPLDVFGERDDNALTYCARDGREDCFRVLADFCRDNSLHPHTPNGEGSTPLMIAACYGNITMCKTILQFDPDLADLDLDGESVFEQLNRDTCNNREDIKNLFCNFLVKKNLLGISRNAFL